MLDLVERISNNGSIIAGNPKIRFPYPLQNENDNDCVQRCLDMLGYNGHEIFPGNRGYIFIKPYLGYLELKKFMIGIH